MDDPTLPLPDEDDEPAAEMTVADHSKNSRAMADNLMKCPSSEQHLHNIQAVTAQAIRNLCDVVEELAARPTGEVNPAEPVESSIDTIRLNHFIVHTCRFQIDMATGETHRRGQIYKTLRDAIDADMGVPAETSVGEKSYECIACGTAIDSETVDRNLERCDPCAAAGKTDETGYPSADAIAEDKRERAADATQPSTRPHQEIERLASFIQSLHCGKPSQNQGAVDTAIRMIGTMHSRLHGLARESFDGYSTTSASTEERIDRCMEEFIDWCKRTMPHFQKGPEFKVAKAFDDELREICRRHVTGPREPAGPAPLWLGGEIVDFLNALVETDRDAVRALFNSRVPCNQKLADDPTVQVRAYGLEDKPHDFEVGILGLLNGFVGVDEDGNGVILMVVDDEDEELIEFRVAVE